MRGIGTSRLWPFALVSLSIHATTLTVMMYRARTASTVSFDPSSQTLAGDTLDVDPPAVAAREQEDLPDPSTRPSASIPARSRPRYSSMRAFAATPAAAPAAPPALFGAVGVRFATDLATTFTRAFPQAGSADPLWWSVAFGSAGRAEVTLVLDEDGHLAKTDIDGSPSLALRRSIERTLLLLGPRVFTAHGALTRLAVAAHVSRDDVHDGLHGDVFALSAGSFSGEVGTAFFALPPAAGPGRRVDVQVRLLP